MILLTGFEPFTTGQGLKLTHNPTGDIATSLGSSLTHVQGAVLPVSFTQTKTTLTDMFVNLEPTHWVGLGFAPHRTTIDVEAVALNLEHARSGDNDGKTPFMRPIVEGAPLAYRSRVDTADLAKTLNGHSVPAQTNCHAGTFLCNQTFYLGCHWAESSHSLQTAVFIHVPPMERYESFQNALGEWLKGLA